MDNQNPQNKLYTDYADKPAQTTSKIGSMLDDALDTTSAGISYGSTAVPMDTGVTNIRGASPMRPSWEGYRYAPGAPIEFNGAGYSNSAQYAKRYNRSTIDPNIEIKNPSHAMSPHKSVTNLTNRSLIKKSASRILMKRFM